MLALFFHLPSVAHSIHRQPPPALRFLTPIAMRPRLLPYEIAALSSQVLIQRSRVGRHRHQPGLVPSSSQSTATATTVTATTTTITTTVRFESVAPVGGGREQNSSRGLVWWRRSNSSRQAVGLAQ